MASITLSKKSINPVKLSPLIFFTLALVCGVAVFIFGSNYFVIFPTNKNLTYNLFLSAAFLIGAIWLKLTARWKQYWPVAFAFFVASLAFPVTSLFSSYSGRILAWLNLSMPSSPGIAIAKVWEMLLIVTLILVLTKVSGASLSEIFLQRGHWKLGLSIGTLVWFNFATSVFLFFATRYSNPNALGAALGWGLVFSSANGFMEELWLRGIFLKRFDPFLGLHGSVWLTSIVFGLMHSGVVYITPMAIPFMLINTITLGLACGYLMMKTNSIWGAVLIHAAADLFLFIAMLANP